MRPFVSHIALVLSVPAVIARLLHSLPEDTYAFPKFRVAFLNSLPVLNQTADHWLRNGLRGGELEFLDQPWKLATYTSTAMERKGIESGYPSDSNPSPDAPSVTPNNFTLELMKLGSQDAYVCLIPKPLDNIPSQTEDHSDAGLTAVKSWSLLQPLIGTCLYHRHGWFTYSYCHNNEIRQFKEMIPQTPRLGPYIPEEDPEWEAYTLGRAPIEPTPGADLTVAEQNLQAANLELAKSAGSRYLVQRWGDGTLCDKTGKPREVEVQFHCSMTMTDSIQFVKETKTCSYILAINTPRLCGEPGFKSKRDAVPEAEIRCREIVNTLPEEPLDLPVTDHPIKGPHPRKTTIPASIPNSENVEDGDGDDAGSATTTNSRGGKDKDDVVGELLRQTIETLMKEKLGGRGPKPGEPTEVVIELFDGDEDNMEMSDMLVDALRKAGYDIRGAEFLGLKVKENDGKKGKGDKEEKKKPRYRNSEEDNHVRDEL